MRLILQLSFLILQIHARIDKAVLPFDWYNPLCWIDEAVILSFKVITAPISLHSWHVSSSVKKRISQDL